MSINYETNIAQGLVAFAKVLIPAKKYQKQDEFELSIDVVVSEDDADIWDEKFKKQTARTVKTSEFENIYKFKAPFPDQKKQFIIRLKRDTTYKDGNPVPEEYWPKVFKLEGSKRKEFGSYLKKNNIGIANGSTAKVSFEVSDNDFGTFARLKNILVTNLIEYKGRGEAGDEFGCEEEDGAGEFDGDNQSQDQEQTSSGSTSGDDSAPWD